MGTSVIHTVKVGCRTSTLLVSLKGKMDKPQEQWWFLYRLDQYKQTTHSKLPHIASEAFAVSFHPTPHCPTCRQSYTEAPYPQGIVTFLSSTSVVSARRPTWCASSFVRNLRESIRRTRRSSVMARYFGILVILHDRTASVVNSGVLHEVLPESPMTDYVLKA